MVQQWDDKRKNMLWELSQDLKETIFYKSYFNLLNDKRLKGICRKNGYKIVFFPHPLIGKFFHRTIFKHYQIAKRKTSYNEWFGKGALLITDYSSVAFDFLYLKKPVIYYQFDKDDFFKNHTYKPGYFNYDDELFGKVATEQQQLIDIIENYIKNDCTLLDEHVSNIEDLFHRTDNHCEKLYEKLLSIYRVEERRNGKS